VAEHSDLELKLLLEAIFQKYHYDFRGYAVASIRRRLDQAISAFGCKTLSGLQERVLHDAGMFTALLRYLTVQVTDMFRDPSYFRTFRERVVPVLRTYPSLRLWIAGCATGEEPYSFAIILREEGLLERSILYATDINSESLERAEEGVYPLNRIAAFSELHQRTGTSHSLSEHYTAAYGAAVMDRTLRSHVVFSDHSLATDSVFAEAQVISCRNVLIYFDKALQDRATKLFCDSLCRKGFLGLGAKESLRFSANSSAFAEFERGERWYQKQ
jgi:chemotaxis protein methyltransferase CheR